MSAAIPRFERGRLGETMAAAYLELCGYRIQERNRRLGPHEIDLVAVRHGWTCFVEVRTRQRSDYGRAAETISPAKRRHLRNAARRWLQETPTARVRFDVITIDWQADESVALCHWVDAWQ